MALLGFAFAEDLKRVRKLFWWIGVFSVLINLFGLIQYVKGPGWVIGTFGPGMLRAIGGLKAWTPRKSFFVRSAPLPPEAFTRYF